MSAVFRLVFLMTLASQLAFGQVDSTETLYRVVTVDGNYYLGEITIDDDETIRLKTDNIGEITLRKEDIKSIKAVYSDQLPKELWIPNAFSSRYLAWSNGYGLRKGEGYYQNIWIYFNQASYGITDNFSFGVGVVPLFLFLGAPSPVWITPKLSVPVVEEKFNLGLGAIAGTITGWGSGETFGGAYGVGTLGSRDKNVNLGLGYGFAGGEWANTPLISVSGMYRFSKSGYLLTENYFVDIGPETLVVLSLAGRAMLGKPALDFGLFFPMDFGGFFGIPWLSISIPFGK